MRRGRQGPPCVRGRGGEQGHRAERREADGNFRSASCGHESRDRDGSRNRQRPRCLSQRRRKHVQSVEEQVQRQTTRERDCTNDDRATPCVVHVANDEGPVGVMTRIRLLRSIWLLAVVPAVGAGCKRNPAFAKEIAPIFSRSCVQCHRAGGVAPVPLLETGPQAVAAASKIRLAVQRREMPPWGADNTGLCRTWRDALWLADDEVEKIVKWTESPDPGPATAPPLRPGTDQPFAPSGAVVDSGATWKPGLGSDAYRCFVADPHLAQDALVSAFRIVSTDPRSVQQVTLYALETPAAEADAEALDRAEDGPGYSCYGSSRVEPARLVMSWTWDSYVLRMPKGFAMRLAAGRKLVVQIHYNIIASGLDAPTRTRVELETDPAAREASFVDVAPAGLRLAPRQTRVEAAVEKPMSSNLVVLGIAPRMHVLGKTMQVDLVRGTEHTCAASFDHWDFYRQRLFIYEKPLDVHAGDSMRVSCVYTTRGRTAPVGMGPAIDDEECLASLLVAGPAR
jgi:mono/diheme cytochrome c family protein